MHILLYDLTKLILCGCNLDLFGFIWLYLAWCLFSICLRLFIFARVCLRFCQFWEQTWVKGNKRGRDDLPERRSEDVSKLQEFRHSLQNRQFYFDDSLQNRHFLL